MRRKTFIRQVSGQGHLAKSYIGRLAATALATFVLAILSATAATATEKTLEPAKNFIELCDSKKPENAAMCPGFVGGVLEVILNNQIYGIRVCVPPHTAFDLDQVVSLTKNWIHNHPEDNFRPASLAIAQALKNKFPCK